MSIHLADTFLFHGEEVWVAEVDRDTMTAKIRTMRGPHEGRIMEVTLEELELAGERLKNRAWHVL